MEKPSWVLTVLTQISLCFALYVALNLGHPHNYRRRHGVVSSGSFEVCFISFSGGGGIRSDEQWTVLLNQMEMVAKAYDVKFVVNFDPLGNYDQILQNGIKHFPSLRVPWYRLDDSREKGSVYVMKQVELPLGKSLDIYALKTSLFKDSSSKDRSDQIGQLSRMLEAADSQWSIIFGLHPLAACGEGNQHSGIQPMWRRLHNIFLTYRVNAYLSGTGCVNYVQRDGVAYISHPGSQEKRPLTKNLTRYTGKLEDGFLFHRASLLEFETYFVTLNGNVTEKVMLHQRGGQAI